MKKYIFYGLFFIIGGCQPLEREEPEPLPPSPPRVPVGLVSGSSIDGKNLPVSGMLVDVTWRQDCPMRYSLSLSHTAQKTDSLRESVHFSGIPTNKIGEIALGNQGAICDTTSVRFGLAYSDYGIGGIKTHLPECRLFIESFDSVKGIVTGRFQGTFVSTRPSQTQRFYSGDTIRVRCDHFYAERR
ncbi:MAG: hypothetical protein RL757_2971 [Bacteroidota bacterium]